MKKVIAICLGALFILSVFCTTSFAVEKKVPIKLPSFPITLNGIKIDTWHRQYPLIIYKDITYFPMTYHDCRFLGIETKWQKETGLTIDKTNITAAYRVDYKSSKNLSTYTAAIPSFPIKVNGKLINNAQEEYPLLTFRNVTYFPLTWKFAVDEFGWDYSFDPKEGLRIGATNPKLERVNLPNYAGLGFMIMGQSVVYQGKEGVVYQGPLANSENAKKIYQLPPFWIDNYARASFYKENGEYFMMYHTGGAVMGTDHYYKITTDGQVEKVLGGNNYSTSKYFNGMQIIAQQGVPPYKNNLVIFDGKEAKNIGNPDYIFAWAGEKKSGLSVGPSRDIYRVQNDLYLLAINDIKEVDHSKIYRLNLTTNALTLVSDIDTNHFILEGNALYFARDTNLYKININGGEPELLTSDLISQGRNTEDFQILNGQVYYINGENQGLYKLGTSQALNEKGKVKMLTRKDQYIIAIFAEEANNPFGLMIFDGEGRNVFRTSDICTVISIDHDLLAYSIDKSGKIYTIKLK